VKYVRTAGLLIDLRRLSAEHRKLFVLAVHALLRPALDAGAHTGAAPWPRALRIHRIGANYSMTWSFASPDGRALLRPSRGDMALGALNSCHSPFSGWAAPSTECGCLG
jgi:hypothetical protein